MAEGIERGLWASARKSWVWREILGGQYIPPYGRLGQGALTAPGGLWQPQKCTFLVAMSVHEKS